MKKPVKAKKDWNTAKAFQSFLYEESGRRQRTWPLPWTTYFQDVSSCRPMGPRACIFWVEMPISAPMPNSLPSVNRVEALI